MVGGFGQPPAQGFARRLGELRWPAVTRTARTLPMVASTQRDHEQQELAGTERRARSASGLRDATPRADRQLIRADPGATELSR